MDGGNYPEEDAASDEPLHSAFRPFDVHHFRMSISLVITYSKSLSLVQLCRSDVLLLRHWRVGDRFRVVFPASQIPPEFLRYTQTGTNVEILWPQCGRPTETVLPLILGMKRGDNALYMFPFLELLIIERSASWPKNRFLMRCCFPVPSPSTRCFWVRCQLQACRQKPQF